MTKKKPERWRRRIPKIPEVLEPPPPEPETQPRIKSWNDEAPPGYYKLTGEKIEEARALISGSKQGLMPPPDPKWLDAVAKRERADSSLRLEDLEANAFMESERGWRPLPEPCRCRCPDPENPDSDVGGVWCNCPCHDSTRRDRSARDQTKYMPRCSQCGRPPYEHLCVGGEQHRFVPISYATFDAVALVDEDTAEELEEDYERAFKWDIVNAPWMKKRGK